MKLISSTSRFGGFGENFLLEISQRDAGACGVGWARNWKPDADRGTRWNLEAFKILNEKKRDIYLPSATP